MTESQQNEPLNFECDNVAFEYFQGEDRSPLVVFSGVDFKVEPATTIGIVGKSGSGKTALFGVLTGLLKPVSGNIILGEEKISKLTRAKLRRFCDKNIGMVFSKPVLLPCATVFENVMLAAKSKASGMSRSDTEKYAKQVLDYLGLDDMQDVLIERLDKQELIRVAFARAFINKPAIVIADNPGCELQYTMSKKMIAFLRHCAVKTKTSLILLTDCQEQCENFDRVYNLRDGCLK